MQPLSQSESHTTATDYAAFIMGDFGQELTKSDSDLPTSLSFIATSPEPSSQSPVVSTECQVTLSDIENCHSKVPRETVPPFFSSAD